jgi:hypothetical protein
MKEIFLVGSLLFSATVIASPVCTKEDKSKWQDQKKFQDTLVKESGYKIKKFKVTDGNCYEIYGINKEGKKVEIYFNPIDASKVKEEIH